MLIGFMLGNSLQLKLNDNKTKHYNIEKQYFKNPLIVSDAKTTTRGFWYIIK